MTDQRSPKAAAIALERELERVQRFNAERGADPMLAQAIGRLSAWQANRLAGTYADLAAQPCYADAIAFFRTDLYGPGDFTRRDSELARAAPSMTRILPAQVIASLAMAMELHALSQELDRMLLARLPRPDAPFSVAEYCDAYRGMDRRPSRVRQIELIGAFGRALEAHLRTPLIHAALVMMRKPARVAGLSALQEFLERGTAAFRKMKGASTFLATIDERERELMNAIFAGESAPFPDPRGSQPGRGTAKGR